MRWVGLFFIFSCSCSAPDFSTDFELGTNARCRGFWSTPSDACGDDVVWEVQCVEPSLAPPHPGTEPCKASNGLPLSSVWCCKPLPDAGR